jgi:hypothetical protein
MKLDRIEIGGRKFSIATGNILCPEYMPRMIKENMPKNLVPFSISIKDGLNRMIYETDTMEPIRTYLLENGADEHRIKTILMSMDSILAVCGELLIDSDYIVMDMDAIYFSQESRTISYIFNPFECDSFADAGRKMLAEITGNYFMDHGVSGEVFRERLLRELGKKEFNIRNIISRWDELATAELKEETAGEGALIGNNKKKDLFKGFLNKLSKKEDTQQVTTAIPISTGRLFLTGLCNMNARIPIRKEGVIVGRIMLQKEYGLFNSGIGKTHARIYEQDGSIYATDLGSKNGTYLNGEILEKRIPVKVEKGDILAFSDEEFILC